MSVKDDVLRIARDAREASLGLARLDAATKNNALYRMADELVARAALLKEANRLDTDAAVKKGLTKAMVDRLTLSDKVITGMANGLREVASLADPVGEITKMWKRPNGLLVGKMRIPIGVIGIIYESRPNVTADAAALCLKSGNAVILRGGSEAINSNNAIAKVLNDACASAGVPAKAVQVIPVADREAVLEMLKLEQYIDLIIPRGGEGLIRFVVENSKIPVIKHYKGVCHVFVDEYADPKMAENIAFNAKVQRPGVCNSMETLLVHKNIAGSFLPGMFKKYKDAGVELRGCPKTVAILKEIKEAGKRTGQRSTWTWSSPSRLSIAWTRLSPIWRVTDLSIRSRL
jgi:glutamate-5-semialdehyde dehydrogenase